MATGPKRPRLLSRGFVQTRPVPRRQSGQQLAGTTLSQQTRPGVKLAPGLSQQFDASGKPIGFARTGAMKLAPGYQVSYDAKGRATFSKIPAAPVAPAPAPAQPQAPAQPETPDPRDARYTGAMAQLLADNRTARGSITKQQEYDQQDLARTIAQMVRARGEDLTDADYGANKQGLLFSGALGKRRGNIERDYTDRQTEAELANARRMDAYRAELDRLGTITEDASSPLGFTGTGQAARDIAAAYEEALGRRIPANEDVPVAAPEEPAAAPAPSEQAPTARKLKSYTKNGWFYREAADGSGKMLRIRRAT